MKNSKITIDVCLASYKRPELLRLCLESIAGQTIIDREDVDVRIVVIDNDAEKSAEKIVLDFSALQTLSVSYDVETNKNIALARNRALMASNSDLIAFIDDDEVADSRWLEMLFNAIETYSADISTGPVEPLFPKKAPDWAVKGGYYHRHQYKEGELLKTARTNNVLLYRSALPESENVFDPAYGITGGSDTRLFSYMHKLGCKIVRTNKAVVSEWIPYERLTLRWLFKRAYRVGQVEMRVYFLGGRIQDAARFWVMSLLVFGYGLLQLIVAFPLGKVRYVKYLRKVARRLGNLTSIFGIYYKEYS